MARSRDVVVVGAGHNGLTAAAVLARAGRDVLVVERRAVPGGAAASDELVPGFRFPTCAYAVHMLHEEVVDELRLGRYGVRMLPLPDRVAVLPGGSMFEEDREPAAERWRDVWDRAARAVDRHLVGPPPPKGAFDGLGRLAAASYVDVLHDVFSSPEARCAFAPLLPCDPARPGSALAYAYFRTDAFRPPGWQGVPEGGMRSLAEAFVRAAADAGAEVRTTAEVRRVLVRGGEARGVELADGEEIPAGTVLSNADPKRTLGLAGLEPPPLETRPGGAKLHCALREEPRVPGRSPLVHLYPSLDWYRRAESVIELQVPTLLDPSLAPPGSHCLSAYLPFGAPWGPERLLALVEERVPNVRDALVEAVFVGPRGLEERLGLTDGCIHHLTHVPEQSYAARPGPRTAVPGLYLCGAGTHPGGEISGVPGLNAARALLRTSRAR